MDTPQLRQSPVQAQRRLWAGGLTTLTLFALPMAGWAQSKPHGKQTTPALSRPAPAQPLRPSYDVYILGPGDSLEVELLNIPELSGRFSIGPDGTLYLPRLRALYVEELRYFLTEQFKAYVKNPQLYVRPVGFRAVRVYVGGEITRPGYYLLSGPQKLADELSIREGVSPLDTRRQATSLQDFAAARVRLQRSAPDDITTLQGINAQPLRWPTLFDALRAAQGVTPYSNLGAVQVVRKQPLSAGGGKMQAQVDFLQLVTNGDESVNIRLFDGDVISVARSPQVLREQLLAASRTNLSPDFIEVFVSGRVKEPGPQSLPQGATLNQAIASARVGGKPGCRDFQLLQRQSLNLGDTRCGVFLSRGSTPLRV